MASRGGVGRLACLSSALALSASFAWAQHSVRLDFPDEGSRDVWFAPDLPTGTPTPTINTTARSVDFPIDRAGAKDKLFVWDRKTGNLAVRAVADIKGVWPVKEADFKLIALVRVTVKHDAMPVEVAMVGLQDKGRKQTELIDKHSKGVAEFYGVAPGQVTLLTTYKLSGKTQPALKQIFTLELRREKPEPELASSVADAVDTVGAHEPAADEETAPQATTPKAVPKEESRPNVFVQILLSSLILGGCAVGLYYLIQYLNKNSDKVRRQLDKLGVQVPDASPGDSGDAQPPRPAAPPPPERIILDDPSIAAAAGPAIVAPVGTGATFGNPRLLGDAGQIYQLAEGASLVSREAGAPISLGGETSVSRRHAEVVRMGNAVVVRDLGSTNGTYVNGVKVVGEATLNPGDVVLFGTVRLRFEG